MMPRSSGHRVAGGTNYYVYRRFGVNGPLTFLGTSGERKFFDDTIPAGTSAVTYHIYAARSTGQGLTAEFPIQFGATGPRPSGLSTPTVALARGSTRPPGKAA